jgi:hypothetical protein
MAPGKKLYYTVLAQMLPKTWKVTHFINMFPHLQCLAADYWTISITVNHSEAHTHSKCALFWCSKVVCWACQQLYFECLQTVCLQQHSHEHRLETPFPQTSTVCQLTGDCSRPSCERHSNVAPQRFMSVPSCRTFVSSLTWNKHIKLNCPFLFALP